MAEVTYYFDHYKAIGNAWDNPELAFDGNLTTFAYTDDQGNRIGADSNSCPGTNLGTITKVELRVYGHGDGDDQIILRPRIGGTIGEDYPVTPPSSAGWSAYADITNDLEAPSPWTWTDIDGILLFCAEYSKVGKGNTMYCAKVDIRVTYTPVAPPVKPTQYFAGHDCPEFPHEMDLLSNKLPCPPPY